MRIAAAILFAVIALPALAAEQLPDFRPGLWEFKRSVDAGDGKPATLTNQKCTSPTDDMNRKTESMATSGCQATPVSRSGNIYSFSFKCTIQGVPVESRSVITVTNESAYKVDVETRQGSRTSREQLDARRVGDCKAE